MSGNTLAIALPLAALVIAGISIVGVWYWWTSSRDADSGPPTIQVEDEAPPIQDKGRPDADEEMEGSFFSRLAGTFRPADSASQSQPSTQPMPSGTLSTGAASSPVTPVEDAIEVMRILRDLADGSVIVEINGRRYRRLADIKDAQIGRRFIGNAQALARFALLGDLNIPDDWSAPPPNLSDQLPPPPLPAQSEQWQTAPPARPAVQPASTDAGRRSGPFGGGRSAEKEEPAPVLSMAEQIEELLQLRLTATPELAQRSIHIRPALDGGVRIEVDGKFYEGVGDVADQHIREFIQSTIREWEARQ